MKTYRFGIIGLGVMGREMAELLAAHPRFSVVAGFDPAGPSVLFPLLPSAEAVIADSAVDAVYTATPPRVHEDVIRLAAGHRKPILCEKPLAHSIASARACRDLAASADIAAAVNFSFAARDLALRLGHIINSGRLGRLTGISLKARFAQWPRSWQSGAGAWLASAEEGGFTREVVSHYVFLANRLFGPGRLQKAQVTRPAHGTETSLLAEVSHGDLLFRLDAAIAGTRDDDIRFAVTGEAGEAAIVDWQYLDFPGDAAPRYPASAPLDHLALLLDGKPNQLASLDEGLAVVELIEAMLA
jgi:predicted dehydrogenase